MCLFHGRPSEDSLMKKKLEREATKKKDGKFKTFKHFGYSF